MKSLNSNDLIFKYEAFGLKIHSEIRLPELKPLKSEKSDINIYLGEVDLPTRSVLDEGISYKLLDNTIYRFWDVIGKFKITADSIIVNSAENVDKVILRNFLLGTVFATLLRLKGLFVLHASSINMNGSAIAFSGFKGSGKSTTAMAFYNEGYPIVADDYITIQFDGDIPIIFPGFPSLRLSSKSRAAMGLNFDKSNLERNIMDKAYASVPKSFSSNKIPLKKVYILQRNKESKIIDLKPQEAFMELIKNTFSIHMFSKLELPDNFVQCERIVKNLDLSILVIPDSLEKIHEVTRMVEMDIEDKL
ncbi:hypothetical protein [Methanobacterium spitsbergense]|uniref:HPr kinase n=1 Tax=Methanobacterium spitsbergense TaxID=2874285 RepID=A0A8T5UZT8_9EURY|nr:hypothetical protein [Methanobacterium spitsbergense]MBZ2166323.1 hypothetical protein [Methanobacterium spitsbergense]